MFVSAAQRRVSCQVSPCFGWTAWRGGTNRDVIAPCLPPRNQPPAAPDNFPRANPRAKTHTDDGRPCEIHTDDGRPIFNAKGEHCRTMVARAKFTPTTVARAKLTPTTVARAKLTPTTVARAKLTPMVGARGNGTPNPNGEVGQRRSPYSIATVGSAFCSLFGHRTEFRRCFIAPHP